jgi:N-methylhydantoinase A
VTLGVDVGGTFTDLVWWDGEQVKVGKTTSTKDQSVGVESGAMALTGDVRVPLLVHGTTVATNALLERAGASVALVTDPGFEDVLEIARQDRPSLYDSDVVRPAPLVPRHLRFGGTLPGPSGADAVAVVLIDSYRDPARERELAARVAEIDPTATVVASCDVSGEFREFERTSTTVLTAYLRPAVERYLSALEERVRGGVADRLLVMQSSGGLVPASHAGERAASILLSGPAGGVVAAAAFGSLIGHDTVISFDMGGTSTDVCRVEGGTPEVSFERTIDGHVVRLPSVAVHTVGAGGGSVGWIDPGDALRVGPRSAGAFPGPASYGRGGTEPTVTDADLFTGRLAGDVALADGLRLDHARAAQSLEELGGRLRLSPAETALGMIEVVESHMERAVRRVSVEEGFDPAAAALVAFGGAGGMHAMSLAASLGMGTVIVPPNSGVLSALGLLLSAPRIDVARTVLLDERRRDDLASLAAELAREASGVFREAVGPAPDTVSVTLDVRYVGQSHETSIPYEGTERWDVVLDRFHDVHRRRNGFSRPDDPVEVVTLRAAAIGHAPLTIDRLPSHVPEGERRLGSRFLQTGKGTVDVPVFRRQGMALGTEIIGPAVVVDPDATTWIAERRPGPAARQRDVGDRPCVMSSASKWPATDSPESPRRWVRCCAAPPTRRTSRSGRTVRRRSSLRMGRCSPRQNTFPFISVPCLRRSGPCSTG